MEKRLLWKVKLGQKNYITDVPEKKSANKSEKCRRKEGRKRTRLLRM